MTPDEVTADVLRCFLTWTLGDLMCAECSGCPWCLPGDGYAVLPVD